jgi:hypothetical protein
LHSNHSQHPSSFPLLSRGRYLHRRWAIRWAWVHWIRRVCSAVATEAKGHQVLSMEIMISLGFKTHFEDVRYYNYWSTACSYRMCGTATTGAQPAVTGCAVLQLLEHSLQLQNVRYYNYWSTACSYRMCGTTTTGAQPAVTECAVLQLLEHSLQLLNVRDNNYWSTACSYRMCGTTTTGAQPAVTECAVLNHTCTRTHTLTIYSSAVVLSMVHTRVRTHGHMHTHGRTHARRHEV